MQIMSYLTPVNSGVVPSVAVDSAPQKWSPENDQTVNKNINEAMNHAHGNVEQAFAYLRDKRQQPSNYYDTNLAIAADYLRARWDTQQHGPEAETQAIGLYMTAKRLGLERQEGPGPVSPYSDKENAYMLKGVQDQAKQMPFLEKVAWDVPLFPGITAGQVKAVIDNIRALWPFR
jgi:hypothetical protein